MCAGTHARSHVEKRSPCWVFSCIDLHLTAPGACQFSSTGWPASFRAPPHSACMTLGIICILCHIQLSAQVWRFKHSCSCLATMHGTEWVICPPRSHCVGSYIELLIDLQTFCSVGGTCVEVGKTCGNPFSPPSGSQGPIAGCQAWQANTFVF